MVMEIVDMFGQLIALGSIDHSGQIKAENHNLHYTYLIRILQLILN